MISFSIQLAKMNFSSHRSVFHRFLATCCFPWTQILEAPFLGIYVGFDLWAEMNNWDRVWIWPPPQPSFPRAGAVRVVMDGPDCAGRASWPNSLILGFQPPPRISSFVRSPDFPVRDCYGKCIQKWSGFWRCQSEAVLVALWLRGGFVPFSLLPCSCAWMLSRQRCLAPWLTCSSRRGLSTVEFNLSLWVLVLRSPDCWSQTQPKGADLLWFWLKGKFLFIWRAAFCFKLMLQVVSETFLFDELWMPYLWLMGIFGDVTLLKLNSAL